MHEERFWHKKLLKLKINKALQAFNLAEMLITMLVLSIFLVVSIPLISQSSAIKTGVDKNVVDCITNNNTAAWYNTTNGNASIPDAATDPKCNAAVTDTQFDRGKAYNTTVWYANQGSTTQQTVAKEILRSACDQGGSKACDYFINKCWTSGAGNASPYCDDASGYLDITYYLIKPTDAYTNNGASYLVSALTNLVKKPVPNLIYEIMNDCQTHPGSLACDIPTGPFDPDNYHASYYSICKNPAVIVSSSIPNYDLAYDIKATTCNVAKNPQANSSNQSFGCWYSAAPDPGFCSGTGCGDDLGSGNYSKFLCTHDVAIAACEGLNLGINYGTGCGMATGCDPSTKGWRLPTAAELAKFYPPGSNLLNLCDDGTWNSPYCQYYEGCWGSSAVDTCFPTYVWSSDSPSPGTYDTYALLSGSWGLQTEQPLGMPYSVRCVRTL